MTLQLRIATHSEIGPVRKNNQDSGYASPHLLVVADGMGGAAAGDLASAVAVDTIREVDALTAGPQMLQVLSDALRRANDRIAALVDADYTLEGMGTTVTGALFDGAEFGLAHIGDSRAYLLHDSRLERLTRDHTWVQSLVDDGKISEGEAAVHPHRSLLLKVLNGQPASEPDLTRVPAVVGDRLLLCSDGLCGLVDDAVIEEAMRLPDLEQALRRLVDGALTEGGFDNITVILADVVEEPAQPPAPTSAHRPAPTSPAPSSAGPASSTSAAVVLGAAAELAIRTAGAPIPGGPVQGGSGQGGSVDEGPAEDTVTLARLGSGTASSARPGTTVFVGASGPDDEERYRPQPPHHRRPTRALVGFLVLVLLVLAGLGTGYAWTRTQFYVGAAGDRVAIFQGLSDGVPGISLSSLYEVQPLLVAALPPYYQEMVRGNIDVSGLPAARQTVTQLTDTAERCALVAPRSTPSPSTSTSTVSPRPPTPAPSRSSIVAPTVTPPPPGATTSVSQATAESPRLSSGPGQPEPSC